jgi:hypothetical protein
MNKNKLRAKSISGSGKILKWIKERALAFLPVEIGVGGYISTGDIGGKIGGHSGEHWASGT